jgi:hypothetical protein
LSSSKNRSIGIDLVPYEMLGDCLKIGQAAAKMVFRERRSGAYIVVREHRSRAKRHLQPGIAVFKRSLTGEA